MAIPNPHLRDFWRGRARFRILYGGRDSSKSWDAGARATFLAYRGKLRILCTRMYQNRIEESVYTTIKKQIYRFGYQDYFDILRNKIVSHKGSEFIFYGLARNISEIKSLEGVDILWIEEAHNLTKEMWEILEPTIRKEGSEIWVILNPQYQQDFAYQRFIVDPPDGAKVRKINYDQNPFLSKTSEDTINRIKEEDYQAYEHIYLGVPKQDDEAVIIKRKWIQSAIDAHKKLEVEPKGIRMLGYDVADAGDDYNATARRHGILVENVTEWKGAEDELMQSVEQVHHMAHLHNCQITYDSIGVGAGCGSKFSELNDAKAIRIKYHGFNAGSKVVNPDKEYAPKIKNKDHFANLKSQSWWYVADRFRNTYNAVVHGMEYEESEIISIASDCNHLERLITELSTPKRTYDGSGRVKVESKKDLSKRGVDSPNMADALIMAFAPRKESKPLSPRLV